MNTGYWLFLLAVCGVLFVIGLRSPRKPHDRRDKDCKAH